MSRTAHPIKISLRAVVYSEEGTWLAHCLEMDIVEAGKSANEALRNLVDLCRLQVKVALEEKDLESIFRPAPAEAWKMFSIGADMKMPRKTIKPVEKFEARELQFA